MPRFKVKAKNQKVLDKIQKAFDETEIIQRPEQLTYGRWDFAVFGSAGKNKTTLRLGFAEQAVIRRAPVYIASLAEPGWTDLGGVPVEEFLTEDVPEEYLGLEIIQIDPVRPLTIQTKKSLPGISKAAEQVCREYEDKNIAVIKSPHENDWFISVMKYLNECDAAFPDQIQESFWSARRSPQSNLFSFDSPRRSRDFLN